MYIIHINIHTNTPADSFYFNHSTKIIRKKMKKSYKNSKPILPFV